MCILSFTPHNNHIKLLLLIILIVLIPLYNWKNKTWWRKSNLPHLIKDSQFGCIDHASVHQATLLPCWYYLNITSLHRLPNLRFSIQIQSPNLAFHRMHSSYTRLSSIGSIHSYFLLLFVSEKKVMIYLVVFENHYPLAQLKWFLQCGARLFNWHLMGLQSSSVTIFPSSRIQHAYLTEVTQHNNWHKGETQSLAHKSQFSLSITSLQGSSSSLWILPFFMNSPLNKEGQKSLNTTSRLVWPSVVNEINQSSSSSISF